MNSKANPAATQAAAWTPRLPALTAFGINAFWVLLLCLPMFAGRWLVSSRSDQMFAGVPFRWFEATEWHRTGHIPLWNPYMFGGLPFVGAMHGDIFYPTAWLRMVLPIDVAMNLGFATHVVLAGFFAWIFFRVMRLSWMASMVGSTAYELSGIVASMVSPGHDGKLFVSALMPLLLVALVLGIRDKRLEGFGLAALVVGLGLISPHIQTLQYALIFAGLFALYLGFWSPDRPEPAWRWRSALLGLAAVVLGFGIGMIQLYPFFAYMPWSARAAGAQGWEYATSYAMPWPHVVDWLVSDFTGALEHYSGGNFFKYQSEYVGAGVLALAALGVGRKDRRALIWFGAGTALLFVLVCLGAHSPFYRLWYELVPGTKSMRAPAMAFFIPTFVFALFAALGVERIEAGTQGRATTGLFAAGGLLLLLGASGVLGNMAVSFAATDRSSVAVANEGRVALSAATAALAVFAIAALALLARSGRLRGAVLAALLVAVVGGDLFLNMKRFWGYSPPAAQVYADDGITRYLEAAPRPFRVLDPGVYPTAFLMAKGIAQVIGHHGNELNDYDNLLGGKNTWTNLFPSGRLQDLLNRNRNLYDLLAVRYVVLPQSVSIPGFHLVAGPALIAPGGEAVLLEADSAPPYARVIPAAVKVPADRIVPTLMDARLDLRRAVLLPEDAPLDLAPLTGMPEPSASVATVTAWEPGAMTVQMDPAPATGSYLLISENWYPDWRATVDGAAAQVLRGDFTFLTVPVPAGARQVTLFMGRERYGRGKWMTLASLALALGWLLVPLGLRRRRA